MSNEPYPLNDLLGGELGRAIRKLEDRASRWRGEPEIVDDVCYEPPSDDQVFSAISELEETRRRLYSEYRSRTELASDLALANRVWKSIREYIAEVRAFIVPYLMRPAGGNPQPATTIPRNSGPAFPDESWKDIARFDRRLATAVPIPASERNRTGKKKARKRRKSEPRTEPTARQLEAWAAYIDLGSYEAAGRKLGITKSAAYKLVKAAKAAIDRRGRSVHTQSLPEGMRGNVNVAAE